MSEYRSDAAPAPRVVVVRRPAGRSARRLVAALTAVGVVALTAGGALVAQAVEEPRLDELELRIAGAYYTQEALARDSDGDGWTDWYERLQGTDPKDPDSHPGSTYLEVLDRSVFVQSTAFPDRLTVTDLALPEGSSAQDLVALVAARGGVSPLGELGKTLTELTARLSEGGLLASMLEQSAAIHGKQVLEGRTNGVAASLLAGGENSVYLGDGWNVQTGSNSKGGGWVRINDATHMQYHDLSWEGLRSTTADIVNHDDGTSTTYYTVYLNGKAVRWGYKKWNMDTGEEVEVWYDEATGKQLSSSSVPPSATSPASASATGSASASASASASGSASGGASPSPEASKSPSADPSPSASTTYGNPDVDEASVLRMPTAAEVEARVAFLSGVRARFGDKPPVLDSELVPEPGVADPADPECDKWGCVFFVEVSAPRLGNVHGGCPVPPDLKP